MTDTYIKSGPWTICKVTVKGVDQYEVWVDGEKKRRGGFPTFEAARAYVQRQELGGQA